MDQVGMDLRELHDIAMWCFVDAPPTDRLEKERDGLADIINRLERSGHLQARDRARAVLDRLGMS